MTPALQSPPPRRRPPAGRSRPIRSDRPHPLQAPPSPQPGATARKPLRNPPPPQGKSRSLAAVASNVRVLQPRTQNYPLWLWALVAGQHLSAATALLVGSVALGIYGSTVYAQQQWGRAYGQLQELQVRESQLTSAEAMLRHDLAQQAKQPQSGLVPPSHNTVLFLEPADPRPPVPVPAEPPAREPIHPMGY